MYSVISRTAQSHMLFFDFQGLLKDPAAYGGSGHNILIKLRLEAGPWSKILRLFELKVGLPTTVLWELTDFGCEWTVKPIIIRVRLSNTPKYVAINQEITRARNNSWAHVLCTGWGRVRFALCEFIPQYTSIRCTVSNLFAGVPMKTRHDSESHFQCAIESLMKMRFCKYKKSQ